MSDTNDAPTDNENTCKNGDGRKIYSQLRGICQACYRRELKERRKEQEELLLAEDENDDSDFVPLTQKQVDAVLEKATGDKSTLVPPVMENPPGEDFEKLKSVEQLHAYLHRNSHVARRKIIRQMLDRGLDEYDIMVCFLTEPELRERWIDNCSAPLARLNRDFRVVREEQNQRRSKQEALAAYLASLRVVARTALEIAQSRGSKDASAAVRNAALERYEKASQQLALLEGAISVIPGQGVKPTTNGWNGAAKPKKEEPVNKNAEKDEPSDELKHDTWDGDEWPSLIIEYDEDEEDDDLN